MRRASADLPRRSDRRHSTAVALFATSAKWASEAIRRSRPRTRALCRTSRRSTEDSVAGDSLSGLAQIIRPQSLPRPNRQRAYVKMRQPNPELAAAIGTAPGQSGSVENATVVAIPHVAPATACPF